MQIDHGTLVLVADGARTLLLRNDGDRKFALLRTLAHREVSIPRSHELGTSPPGRSFASNESRRSAYDDTDWHQQAEDRAAREAVRDLQQAAAHSDCGIVIVAPPHMLGEMRKHYDKRIESRLLAEIDKDLIGRETDEIARTVSAHPA